MADATPEATEPYLETTARRFNTAINTKAAMGTEGGGAPARIPGPTTGRGLAGRPSHGRLCTSSTDAGGDAEGDQKANEAADASEKEIEAATEKPAFTQEGRDEFLAKTVHPEDRWRGTHYKLFDRGTDVNAVLRLTNLPSTTTEEDVLQFFNEGEGRPSDPKRKAGIASIARIEFDRRDHHGLSYEGEKLGPSYEAYVHFPSKEAAAEARARHHNEWFKAKGQDGKGSRVACYQFQQVAMLVNDGAVLTLKNVHFDATVQDIADFFGGFDVVYVAIKRGRAKEVVNGRIVQPGKSRGVAYVLFTNPRQAYKAKKAKRAEGADATIRDRPVHIKKFRSHYVFSDERREMIYLTELPGGQNLKINDGLDYEVAWLTEWLGEHARADRNDLIDGVPMTTYFSRKDANYEERFAKAHGYVEDEDIDAMVAELGREEDQVIPGFFGERRDGIDSDGEVNLGDGGTGGFIDEMGKFVFDPIYDVWDSMPKEAEKDVYGFTVPRAGPGEEGVDPSKEIRMPDLAGYGVDTSLGNMTVEGAVRSEDIFEDLLHRDAEVDGAFGAQEEPHEPGPLTWHYSVHFFPFSAVIPTFKGNNKVKLTIDVAMLQKDWELSDAEVEHMILICGSRYMPKQGVLKFATEQYKDRIENQRVLYKQFIDVVEEAKRFVAEHHASYQPTDDQRRLSLLKKEAVKNHKKTKYSKGVWKLGGRAVS